MNVPQNLAAPAIARVAPQQAPVLTEIAHAAKRHWGYPARWMALWREALTLTPEMIVEDIVYTAIEGGQIVGFYALSGQGRSLCLEHFWVLPDAMGRGVGRSLFRHAMRQAATAGAQRVEIESDPHAEGFYLHMGARRIGQTVTQLEGRPRLLPLLVFEIEPTTTRL